MKRIGIILLITGIAVGCGLLVISHSLIICTVDVAESALQQIVVASHQYHTEFGVWPESLDQFTSNSRDIIFLDLAPHGATDPWGNPFLYMPFNTNSGCGLIVSWGADGEPGGTKHNRDRVMQIK